MSEADAVHRLVIEFIESKNPKVRTSLALVVVTDGDEPWTYWDASKLADVVRLHLGNNGRTTVVSRGELAQGRVIRVEAPLPERELGNCLDGALYAHHIGWKHMPSRKQLAPARR